MGAQGCSAGGRAACGTPECPESGSWEGIPLSAPPMPVAGCGGGEQAGPRGTGKGSLKAPMGSIGGLCSPEGQGQLGMGGSAGTDGA